MIKLSEQNGKLSFTINGVEDYFSFNFNVIGNDVNIYVGSKIISGNFSTFTDENDVPFASIGALETLLSLYALNGNQSAATDVSLLATKAKQDLLLTELQLKASLTQTQPVISDSFISTVNSSVVNLDAGNGYTFTGAAEQTAHSDLMLNLFANQPCLIQLQFSTNGTNWDSTISKKSAAGFNEFATLIKGKRYFRVVVTTDLLTTTIFRLQIQYGQFIQGRSALNSTLNIDNDSLVVRPSDRDLEVSRGLIAGHISINIFGQNNDIDIGTEDIWGTGGYWVTPTAATTVNFVSSSTSDAAAGVGARTVKIEGLDGSYNQVSETLTLNGTTIVASVLSYFIIHKITVLTAGTSQTNVGTITTQWTGGGTPVGPSVTIGKAQTQFCVYQVPSGYTGFLEQFGGGTQGGGTLDLELSIKPFGGVYNLRNKIALNITGTSNADYDYKYPLKILEKSIIKLTGTANTNNTDVSGYFDLVIIENS